MRIITDITFTRRWKWGWPAWEATIRTEHFDISAVRATKRSARRVVWDVGMALLGIHR